MSRLISTTMGTSVTVSSSFLSIPFLFFHLVPW